MCGCLPHIATVLLSVPFVQVYSQDIAGLVIDGGEATEIDNNVIEGTNGPAVIVSGGIWGLKNGYCTMVGGATRAGRHNA